MYGFVLQVQTQRTLLHPRGYRGIVQRTSAISGVQQRQTSRQAARNRSAAAAATTAAARFLKQTTAQKQQQKIDHFWTARTLLSVLQQR